MCSATGGVAMPVVITGRAARARRELTPRRAAVAIAGAWLPAVVLAACLPRYVPVFDRWPAAWGEPPALTHALVAVGRLGAGPVALAGLGRAAGPGGCGPGCPAGGPWCWRSPRPGWGRPRPSWRARSGRWPRPRSPRRDDRRSGRAVRRRRRPGHLAVSRLISHRAPAAAE